MTCAEKVDEILENAEKTAKTDEARERLGEIQIHFKYCEPWYHLDEGKLILTGNWNDITQYIKDVGFETIDDTMSVVAKLLEEAGCELEWSDEWQECEGCSGIFRIKPDGHGWKKSYFTFKDDSTFCEECIIKHCLNDYLEEHEGNDKRAITIDGIDLSEHGYVKADVDFENGLYHGQNDDPKNIGKTLKKNGITRYLFYLDSVGQFDMNFSVWIHEEEIEKFGLEQIQSILRHEVPEWSDNAENAKKTLQQASLQASELRQGEGVVYSKIDVSTGTATTRIVSPEEFADGIKE